MTISMKADRLRPEKRLWKNIATVCILAMAIFSAGCAAQKVDGRWRTEKITTDGSDGEWQNAPQYYDPDRKMTLRVANDDQALYLCLSTGSKTFARQSRMTGLTVWLDPAGGKSQVLGIHIPGTGGEPGRTGFAPGGPSSPGARPPDSDPKNTGDDGNHPSQGHPVQPLRTIAVTYADTTGPLTMELDDVRRTGIDIGVNQLPDRRLVYEFTIAYTSAPSLERLEPGMALGLAVQSGESGGEKKKRSGGGSMGPGGGSGGRGGPPSGGGGMGGPPSGGGGRGPGNSRDGGKGEVEFWLQVLLARPVAEG